MRAFLTKTQELPFSSNINTRFFKKNFWHSRKNQIILKQQNLEGVLQVNKTR